MTSSILTVSSPPNAPASSLPNAPASSLPNAPASSLPNAPASSLPDAPASSLPDAPASSLPDAAIPLSTEQLATVRSLARTLSPSQLLWVSRFFLDTLYEASLPRDDERSRSSVLVASHAAVASKPPLTVLFGTETGHAEQVARRFLDDAVAAGLPVQLHSMADYEPSWIKRETFVLLVVSTHGDGDPPGPARRLYDFLHGSRAPRLEQLRFAVLALGDRTYTHFCKTGRAIDERLATLGGRRLLDRVECDVDFEPPSSSWIADAITALRAVSPAQTGRDGAAQDHASSGATHRAQPSALPIPSTQTQPQVTDPRRARQTEPSPSRDPASRGTQATRIPFAAEVLENLVLSGRGSTKEVRHIELSWAESGMNYEPGDSMAVLPRNDRRYVEALAQTVGLDLAEAVPTPDGPMTLAEALEQRFEIRLPSRSQLRKYALLGAPALGMLIANEAALLSYLEGRELLDVVRDFPVPNLSPERFVSTLAPLVARRYSIASCSDLFPDELHLMVSVVRYQARERLQRGVASGHLSERAAPGQSLLGYVCPNEDFRLPRDPDRPVLMIGPGTGVAPFRAFLQKRKAHGMRGPTWLLFGDRTFRADFSYQLEWQRMIKDGVLTRMDVAFSRDGGQRHYVQHRLAEHARDVHDWLERGAHVYVCGDRHRMARDVDDTLASVISRIGSVSMDAARARLSQMKTENRYQRDVY